MSNYVYVVNEKLETSGLINYCQMNSAHILQWFPAQLVVKHTLRHYIFQVGSRTCSLSRSPCAPLIYRCTKSFVLVIPSTKPPITTSSGLRQRRGRTKACAICHSHFPHRMRVRIVCECFIYLRHNSSEQKRVREKHSRIICMSVCVCVEPVCWFLVHFI